MNTNQFGVPNNLVKTLGLQVKCIQIWGIQIENYKSPEKNSRFFHKNSVFFFILFYFLFVKDKIGVQQRDTEKFAGALRALGLWSRREAGSAGA